MSEDDQYTLGTVLARLPSQRPPQAGVPQPGASPGRVQHDITTQGDRNVDLRENGVSANASGSVTADAQVRGAGGSARVGGGVSGRIEGDITRADGRVDYTLSGEVSGFVEGNASVRGYGASFRAEERGTARFQVSVPESAPAGTSLLSVNPFDPGSMPVGTRITLDAAQHSSREFGANLRYLATSDRVAEERGISVAIEATGPDRVRVSAGPREAIDAYHGIGVDAGVARAMVGRNDRFSGGSIRSAEFDLASEDGRRAYGEFMSRGSLPERNQPGVSDVSTVTRLQGDSRTQLDVSVGRHATQLETGANSASTVRTVLGDGSSQTHTVARYRERDAQLEIDRSVDARGTPTDTSYTFRLRPNEDEAGRLNIAYGRNPPNEFRAGEETALRFSGQDMQRLQELAGRANANIQRTGGNDVMRGLVEGAYGSGPRSTDDFALEMVRNPHTVHGGVPSLLHSIATRAGTEQRGRGPTELTALPGSVEAPKPAAPTQAAAPANARTSPEPASTGAPDRVATAAAADAPPLSSDRNPHHGLYSAIRAQAPQGLGEDRLAQVTAQARDAGFTPERVGAMRTHGNELWLSGTVPGFHARVDLSQPAPAAQDSNARLLLQPATPAPAPTQEPARTQRQEPAQDAPVMSKF